MRRLGDVVETDNADVIRHSDSRLRERVQKADHHLVVRAEHRGEVSGLGEHQASLVSTRRTPVADQGVGSGETFLRHRRTPSTQSFAGIQGSRRSGDVPDIAVSEIQQVTRGDARPLELVDGNVVEARHTAALGDDQRHVDFDLVQGVQQVAVRSNDHDAFDVLREQNVEGIQQPLVVGVVDADDADLIAGSPGRFVECEHALRKAASSDTRADQTNALAATGCERARNRVGAISQLFDRSQDCGPGLHADLILVVDDAGHGLHRDVRELGDVRHDHHERHLARGVNAPSPQPFNGNSSRLTMTSPANCRSTVAIRSYWSTTDPSTCRRVRISRLE